MGVTEIIIRDAHCDSDSVDIKLMPENVKVIRGWNGHPYGMMYGIDKSFDCALYLGYHSSASGIGNPLAHTWNTGIQSIKLNGKEISEFVLSSLIAKDVGVSSIFISGDKEICEEAT